VLALARLARLFSNRGAALLVIPFIVTSRYYLEWSRYVMAEVPALALMLWALVALALYANQRRRFLIVLSGFLCAAALVVKPQTAGFLPTFGIWLLASGRRSDAPLARCLLDWIIDLTLFVGAALLIGVFFVNLGNLRGEYQATVGFHMQEVHLWARQPVQRLAGLTQFWIENRGGWPWPWSGSF